MNLTYKKPDDKESAQEILPPGWYDFEVINVYDKDQEGNPLKAKTGTPFLKVVCQEETTGKVIWHLVFLEVDNAKKISALLYACQVEVCDGEQVTVNAATFMARQFRGKVEANPGFDGVHRNRIVKVIRRKAKEASEGDSEPQPPVDPPEGPAPTQEPQPLDDGHGNSIVMTQEQEEKETALGLPQQEADDDVPF